MLDSMIEAGKIKVDKGILTMLAGDNPTFKLLPAYRIVRTVGDVTDPAGMVGQIRAEAELKLLGAELLMDSLIYNDVAYQADTGFIAEKRDPVPPLEVRPAVQPAAAPVQVSVPVQASVPAQAPPPAPKPAEPVAAIVEPPADKAKDGNDLSQFILDNLL